jgi:hypothetical protein
VIESGDTLERATVNKALRDTAARMGLDPDAHKTHSLRAGGASALFALGWPPAKIQRRGRWVSDCWLLYVWQGRQDSKGLVEDLCAFDFSAFVP